VNYRHHFHAGNFADVWKHTLLLALWDALQAKDKGLLYLDTHAGRGLYQLGGAALGDRLPREPEWPLGVGRVRAAAAPPPPVQRYLEAVTACAEAHDEAYPGSPWLIARTRRSQDQAILVEWQPEEYAILAETWSGQRGVRVEHRDGYGTLRAYLPPPQRRALVLIDPPYEAGDEHQRIAEALREGLARLPQATYAVWYPLTARAGADQLGQSLLKGGGLPPTWTAELTVGVETKALRMPGCGLLVINPPWQLDRQLAPTLAWLASSLAQGPGAAFKLSWLVPES
jgi:23S rRNA (adenine2030-N6)-methyltransferase